VDVAYHSSTSFDFEVLFSEVCAELVGFEEGCAAVVADAIGSVLLPRRGQAVEV
jgi:hypothetical protein